MNATLTAERSRRYFQADTLHFLRALKDHNERAWFEANRTGYETVIRDPALRLIEDFTPHLARLSPHFSATPRSLFRIHRDVRFSADKSPYKTHTGIHFRHTAARDVHAPGYYLHIEPESVFVALGIWHPDPATLRTIRELIAAEPGGWTAATQEAGFSSTFTLDGERLRRPPRGFDPHHPLVDALMWKDFIGVRAEPDDFIEDRDLPAALADRFARGESLMRFLCRAVGVPFSSDR